MDTVSWLTSQRATRAYSTVPISEESLTDILQAGRWSGSSKNSQPWTFVVVTDPGLLRQLAEGGRFASHLASASVVVVLVGDPGRGEFDIGRAAQNMMLAANSLGIGSCPATLHHTEIVHSLLEIPETHTARHAIAFGHPDLETEATVRKNISALTGRSRRPLADVVRFDKFDGVGPER